MHHVFQKLTIVALPARSALVSLVPSSVSTVNFGASLPASWLLLASARGSLPICVPSTTASRTSTTATPPAIHRAGCFTRPPPPARHSARGRRREARHPRDGRRPPEAP